MIKGIITFIHQYKYIVVPFLVWFGIQLFKFIYDLITTKKINFKRILQAGGMPSSHSAVVVALTTMVAKDLGIQSPEFGIALIFSFVVKYYHPHLERVHKERKKLGDDGISQVNESIRGVREIKTLGIKNNLFKNLQHIIKKQTEKSFEEIDLYNEYDIVSGILKSLLEVGSFITFSFY